MQEQTKMAAKPSEERIEAYFKAIKKALKKYSWREEILPAIQAIEKEYPAMDINIQNKAGETILHLAVAAGCSGLVSLCLSDKKVNPGATDNEGNTPLHITAQQGRECILELLLLGGADLNWRNNKGDTALHVAVREANAYMVKCLLEKQSNINAQNNAGQTPLQLAVRTYLAEKSEVPLLFLEKNTKFVINILLSRGADPRVRDENKENCFDLLLPHKKERGLVQKMAISVSRKEEEDVDRRKERKNFSSVREKRYGSNLEYFFGRLDSRRLKQGGNISSEAAKVKNIASPKNTG